MPTVLPLSSCRATKLSVRNSPSTVVWPEPLTHGNEVAIRMDRGAETGEAEREHRRDHLTKVTSKELVDHAAPPCDVRALAASPLIPSTGARRIHGSSFLFPRCVRFWDCGSEGGEEPQRGNVLRLIQIRLATPSLQKISLGCQANSTQPQIADSSSRNAVSFSSARTIKRFPSSRCASATKIVCPLELIVDTQPQLQPALLRLSEDDLVRNHSTTPVESNVRRRSPVGVPGEDR